MSISKVDAFYRIVQHGKDDCDMTRSEAIRVYYALHDLLWPRSNQMKTAKAHPKPRKRKA